MKEKIGCRSGALKCSIFLSVLISWWLVRLLVCGFLIRCYSACWFFSLPPQASPSITGTFVFFQRLNETETQPSDTMSWCCSLRINSRSINDSDVYDRLSPKLCNIVNHFAQLQCSPVSNLHHRSYWKSSSEKQITNILLLLVAQ